MFRISAITVLIGLSLRTFGAIVNVTGLNFPSPTANDCSNTFIDVTMQINCINAVYNGSNVNIVGSTITVNVDYTMGAICLGAISLPTHNVNLGMIPAGSYSVVVNGIENLAIVSTMTTSLVVTACCPVDANFTFVNDTVCEGGSKIFTNTSVNANSYKWYVNGTQMDTTNDYFHHFTTAGTYAIKLVATDGTCSDSISKNVVIRGLPEVDLGVDTTICVGDTLVLDVTQTGWMYLWQDNSTNGSLAVTDSGTYYVQVNNVYGCSGGDTVEVALDPCGVGVEEIKTGFMQISPNPSSGQFRIETNFQESTKVQLEVYSITGKLVWKDYRQIEAGSADQMVDLKNAPSGLYFLRMQYNDTEFIQRLMKE